MHSWLKIHIYFNKYKSNLENVAGMLARANFVIYNVMGLCRGPWCTPSSAPLPFLVCFTHCIPRRPLLHRGTYTRVHALSSWKHCKVPEPSTNMHPVREPFSLQTYTQIHITKYIQQYITTKHKQQTTIVFYLTHVPITFAFAILSLPLHRAFNTDTYTQLIFVRASTNVLAIIIVHTGFRNSHVNYSRQV